MKSIAVLLLLVPFCASADTIQGTVVRIADGDTLTILDAKKRERHVRVARVTCAGVDAGAEQVRRGMAWVSPRFTEAGSPLYELEAYARLREVGLWAGSRAIPPWEWQTSKAPR